MNNLIIFQLKERKICELLFYKYINIIITLINFYEYAIEK